MNNYILKQNSLKKNLSYLSFSNNYLTNLELARNLLRLHNLKEIDFHKNQLTRIFFEQQNFNEIKCINCCYNRLSMNQFSEIKNPVFLFSGNIFLTDSEQCQKYFNNLKQQLNDYKIPLTYLTISFLQKDIAETIFQEIAINQVTSSNLKKLDLSYNDLTCDTLFIFLNNNRAFINLKELNLSGNKLDDTFFERFINSEYYKIFNELKKINLKENLIGNDCVININDLGALEGENNMDDNEKQNIYKLRLLYKFIEMNKKLKKLNLVNNPISEKSVDMINNNIICDIHKDRDNNVIINSFYSFLKKITEELLTNKDNRGQLILKLDFDNCLFLTPDYFNLNTP